MKADLLLIGGYIGIALTLMAGLLIAHGTPREIWSAEGFVLAFGGATFATFALLTGADLKMLRGALKTAFTRAEFDYNKLIKDFGEYATISRKDGILALENVANRVDDGFLRRALRMAVDGVDPDQIEDRMATELSSLEERHNRAKSIFDNLATFSPAFGMIGTIMGLVLVLKSLDDPKQIGPKMSVALLSTFYGVFACYAVFTPLAKKLERKHKDENLYRHMVVKGIVWLQSGDSPKVLTSKMEGFLREKLRA
ncbi:MAG: MotA/TolQ/ExbB proton channel family protein [Planctomycetes bacterium]|nr:MotA/TolQ/ExbB proton channel family protein [Planctomycetota bacterium]